MLIQMTNISKSFFGNKVLDNVNFELKAGEVHAIVGGNGAGKSTLINIMSGLFEQESGEIAVNNQTVKFSSTLDAYHHGISVIHQTPSLVPNMSVAENIFLGLQPKILKVFVNTFKMRKDARKILGQLGVSINPNLKVHHLPFRQHYLVSIAKAIFHQSKVLIMDEPTANLTELERENLFRLIKKYKSEGVGIVFITHRLNEIHEVCDRVSILRDGKHVATHHVNDVTVKDITNLMFGYNLKHYYPPILKTRGKELLRIEDLTEKPVLDRVNFSLYEGEILGIAGLAGSGKTELAKIIFGQRKKDSGAIYWNGREIDFKHPIHAVHNRFGYVNENRLTSGLFMNMSVTNNLTIASLDKLNNLKFINANTEADQSIDKVIDLNIKLNHINQNIRYLSGGNQQKVMLARWLMTDCDLYILDEPTRGVDVGSRSEIYLKIHELAQEGKAVLIISSDISELLGLCNRILVMHRGKIVTDLKNENLCEAKINCLMNGNILEEVSAGKL
ncbi:D-xylose ABC transporter ATP-binding protein [Bacillus sp. V3-13]|uniref:sugar ABC transporter ATP-binding protein n=1 Tax=Bacillus sp. V3-13 TaxID=2053728 RepID=UPI000C786285|nr:sugar ABC transporter ATP-binding protein [Bacillus sp. V3-13]PLR76707.1 D-xylose ABC transporter ATP-binding protein [Bacillus sp. V3-13]